jgi:GDP-mannose 6-dehydrogenase
MAEFEGAGLNMRVSVFGLGYVGSVSVACLAALGHTVTGVDISPLKVERILAGRSPVIEANLEELIAQGVAAGRVRATTQAAEAVRGAEVMLVCVGTPSNGNGNLNFEFVDRVCEEIGQALANCDGYPVVVIRSTVLPGSTETRFIPLLERASGRRAGQDFGVAFNPEFLREGTAVDDFYHPPFNVVGQYDECGATLAARLYQDIEAPLFVVPLKVAETVKYVNNAFHALKVGFANEIGTICKAQGIDSHQVMDIFCRDQKLNLSPYYLKPGFAFGGSCLPKDIRALLYHGHRLDLELPLLEAILPSNERQIRQAFELIKQTGSKNIGALGLSFKAGTDDLRESPLVTLIEMLIGKGYQVHLYDRNVLLSQLNGSNRAYIEHEIPHIGTLMRASAEEVIANCEVIVVGNKSPEFKVALQQARPEQVVIDLVRIFSNSEGVASRYEGISW